MGDHKGRFIFMRELTRLYDECERCKDVRIKEEITKDIILLKKAIELLSE
ncbi:MAG TPA: hypothetical protein VEY51_09085 [Chondromyces sp.]|nr:hypothetical protein [Chondromyces sp.]